MGERRRGYDVRCEDLADHFLASEEESTQQDVFDLAQAIQDAIEQWIASRWPDGSESDRG